MAFELLRLHAVTSELGGEDEEGAAQREAALPQLLAQLLRWVQLVRLVRLVRLDGPRAAQCGGLGALGRRQGL